MRFTQVLAGASPGDAITSAALEIDRIVTPVADTSIRARFVEPTLTGIVTPLAAPDDARPPTGDDVILLHVSIGEPDVTSWLEGRPERLVVLYHNIAPPESFETFAPGFADLLRLGRSELPALRDRAVLALAVSEYNADELRSVGFGDVRVCPLVVDPFALVETEPDPFTLQHLREVTTGPVVLFVGQVLPHKRIDWLMEAYFILVTYLIPESHLIVVGSSTLPNYQRILQSFADELNLSRSWLTGRVSAGALAAFYRRADIVVTASEHEGFCVPLLEAMAFDTPVIARRFAAIPETVGDAAVLLDPDDSAGVLAEVLSELVADPNRATGPEPSDPRRTASLRQTLVERGRRRLEVLSADKARTTLRHHLAEVVPGLGDEPPGAGR
ncbi:MAG: glycosyltransferase [Acidimicrobiales bacterium]